MKRMTAVLSAAAMVALTIGLAAQAKTNFAGKWTMEPPAGGAQAGGGGGMGGGRGFGGRGGFGQACTITQDANTLTVEYTQGQNPVKLTYKLDGSESTNKVMMRGGEMDQVSKASWDGASLKIVTTGQNGDTTRVLSLEGGKLVISATLPGRDGSPMTTKVTYDKGM
jgi:hypothetical protein